MQSDKKEGVVKTMIDANELLEKRKRQRVESQPKAKDFFSKSAPEAPEFLHIDDLVPFGDHPFKLYTNGRLDDMVQSIKELGILSPAIVRPTKNGKYEILSGHNRANAAKLAGLEEISAIIKTHLTDDEAKLIVTETNLVQRSFTDLSHSERAIALKFHMDAISKQGKRNDLINEIGNLLNSSEINADEASCQVGAKLNRADEQVGVKYGLSPRNVARYTRLAFLDESLLSRVDNNDIPFIPAVTLSFLSSDEQMVLAGVLDKASYKIDMKKAAALRSFSESKQLTDEKIVQILSGELDKKPKKQPTLKIKPKVYSKYFTDNTPKKEMEKVIDQALKEYFESHKEDE